jgi:prepilin-type N-terminal cleavage/methylation domain-containing protein
MRKGFTLVEIVVAVSLMTAMSGVMMAQYSQFNRRQSVNMATDRIAQVMAEARVNAQSGKKDCYVCGGAAHDCNNNSDDSILNGWRVSINPTPGPGNVPPGVTNGYRIEGICGTTSFFVRDQQFPNNVVISTQGGVRAVTFLPVNGGTNLNYPNLLYVDVDAANGSSSDGFMVSEEGEIAFP